MGRLASYGAMFVLVGSLCACGGSDTPASADALPSGDGSAPAVHSPADQTLQLASLRSGQTVYDGVVLALRDDGTWALKSFGGSRKDSDTTAAATLEPPRQLTTLAAITGQTQLNVRRLHRGSKLLAGVSLLLQGDRWSYARMPEQAGALTRSE